MWQRLLVNFRHKNYRLNCAIALLSIVTVIYVVGTVRAGETLPAGHWAYEMLDHLRTTGCLRELPMTLRPLSRQDVAIAVKKAGKELQSGTIQLDAAERWMLGQLIDEFLPEQQVIKTNSDDFTHLSMWMDAIGRSMNGETEFVPVLKGLAAISPFRSVIIGVSGKFDRSLLNDPSYYGYTWRGLAVYTEQAWLRWQYKALSVVVGRDYAWWGPGKSGQLLLSNVSRPMDQMGFAIRYGRVTFSYLGARLEPFELDKTLADSFRAGYAKRYLSAHRMDIAVHDNLTVGLSEVLLYGGVDEGMELQYHNPFLYYHAELLNRGGSDGNGILGLDVNWYPAAHWQVYGEVIIDDVQVERTGKGDLEPAEYGLLLGGQRTNPFGFNGTRLMFEYVRIANRTYNSPHPWERYLHRKLPLGYRLGNDLDVWNLHWQQWLRSGWRFDVELAVVRKGEGRIKATWETPWMNMPDGQVYSEPFPTGIVERRIFYRAGVRYHVDHALFLEVQGRTHKYINYRHESGVNRTTWDIMLRVWYNLDRMFQHLSR